MSTDTAEAVRIVRRAIRNHQRDVIGRALTWDAVVAAVTAEAVEVVLDSLTAQEQTYLRDVYAEWPPSLWSSVPSEEHAVRAAVERWCRQADADG